MTTRYSIYREVHKGIRSLMTDLIVRAGQTDFSNPQQLDALRQTAHTSCHLLESHAAHENRFVGPLVELHAPLIAASMFDDHDDQEHRIASLLEHLDGIHAGHADAASRGHWFLVELSALFGEMLVHMSEEEHVIMPALWEVMDDAALMQLEQELVASIPPEKMAMFLTWMLPAMNDAERISMLNGMKANAPAEVFASVRGLASAVLPQEVDARLESGLSAPVATAA